MAQHGKTGLRLNGIQEVRGSNPLGSTILIANAILGVSCADINGGLRR